MNDTMTIDQVASRLDISVSTLRRRIDNKTVPKPIKRNSNRETILWRRTDIEAFLGIKGQQAANDAPGSLDAIIDARVEQKVREVLEEMLPQIKQLISQI